MSFSTHYASILDHVESLDPVSYGKTRNFIDGAVTKLSPYISRGVITTRQVYHSVLERGFHPNKVEKFIQELAWRDYWQQVWVEKGEAINTDLRQPQPNVKNHGIAENIVHANTGINAVDIAIEDFYESGYIHNHVRMYIACMACNIGGSHWKAPAQWMYYHLLDGDWASNALSWQWVAGANAGKKYYANQENINKYCYSKQRNSFMDIPYEMFEGMEVPEALEDTIAPPLDLQLGAHKEINVDPQLPSFIYNYYNLDPKWHSEEEGNRILLLEPSVFKRHPISEKCMAFMLGLAENIPNIQIFTGEFSDLQQVLGASTVYFKEHPLNCYEGVEEQRDWMFSVKGFYRSFFGFWKKCQKELPK